MINYMQYVICKPKILKYRYEDLWRQYPGVFQSLEEEDLQNVMKSCCLPNKEDTGVYFENDQNCYRSVTDYFAQLKNIDVKKQILLAFFLDEKLLSVVL